jgi:hypothetical protein
VVVHVGLHTEDAIRFTVEAIENQRDHRFVQQQEREAVGSFGTHADRQLRIDVVRHDDVGHRLTVGDA